MDTLIRGGDFLTGENGLPIVITGDEELLQQALIYLSIPKGAFVHDPALGSRFQELVPAPQTVMDSTALMFAREALAPSQGIEAVSARVVTGETGWPNHVTVKVRRHDSIGEVAVCYGDNV